MAGPGGAGFGFLIMRPENGGVWDLFRFGVLGHQPSGAKFLESSHYWGSLSEKLDGVGGGSGGGGEDHARRWVIVVSVVVRKLLALFKKPLEWTGYLLEFLLNLFSLNGSNFFTFLCKFISGQLVIPRRGSETYTCVVGYLDGRIDLYKSEMVLDELRGHDAMKVSVPLKPGNRALMDLCMMASKLAYENENVVKKVVNLHWKMHFVEFYNCWNEYQQEMSTQVFILCDKPKDANFILVGFRGTELFDADDWSTDFDYSWYEIPEMGKVHMGFLEALGLGNRENLSTFQERLFKQNTESSDSSESSNSEGPFEDLSAYYTVRKKLKSLLEENENARFIVTGHSLGGALAVLFPTVLVMHEEEAMMKQLLGVYTFGQPRVGNRRLGTYMEEHLNHPVPKYFRAVYCNDLVPRLPYDDKTFLYKHFGVCFYYNSMYIEQRVDEEPDPNYFGIRFVIPMYLNAVWELIRGLTMRYVYGEGYKEGWVSIVWRTVGLFVPGMAAHSPVDYVTSIRLAREKM
ncbi:unnamed protein product [Cuscuta campestris]|uniref:Fungal lipase-type domain-containing protein n=1 Tax=Cuscuta campestris TaxID=132261 RepID=A0A484NJW6_9ASTE|nr:unnamed protein product [Cuscuta campestris]